MCIHKLILNTNFCLFWVFVIMFMNNCFGKQYCFKIILSSPFYVIEYISAGLMSVKIFSHQCHGNLWLDPKGNWTLLKFLKMFNLRGFTPKCPGESLQNKSSLNLQVLWRVTGYKRRMGSEVALGWVSGTCQISTHGFYQVSCLPEACHCEKISSEQILFDGEYKCLQLNRNHPEVA